ncbi:hypothetical protein P4H70_06725 [Paenibacillus ehimensis]|uniref:hypothetical protein n=1 Tax=Paenibacillus ehimensis TaxID=79264 RepID=UPI002B806501|nr:hypothetical protein [Paenibacillus ehimensis]MEC0208641.1 hypothetical protein [Paenibacillus ehimensis]HWO95597.1 hypothetical protein [Bacillus sp. (in: firmicutes)]
MAETKYDRLYGVKTWQKEFTGIYGSITLPTNAYADSPEGTPDKDIDYIDFYLILNDFIEAGISWQPRTGWKLFLNTSGGIGPDSDSNGTYWDSKEVWKFSQPGISSIGFGSTITMRLECFGERSSFFVNGYELYNFKNYLPQYGPLTAGYTHGAKDQFGYAQHNTATWSNINLLKNGSWMPWAWEWGYNKVTKHDERYGVYTINPLSAYLAKPNGRDPVIP